MKTCIKNFLTVQPTKNISPSERRRAQAFMLVPLPIIFMLLVMMVMLVLFPDNTGQGVADQKTYMGYFLLITICISFYSASFFLARKGHSALAAMVFVGTLSFGIFSSVMGDPRPGTASLAFPYLTVLFAVLGTFNSAFGVTLYFIISTAIILWLPSQFPGLGFGAHVHFTVLNTVVFLMSLLTAKIRKDDELEIKNHQQEIIHAARLSSLGEMASGIAHEINNPLAIIRGKTEILQMKLEAGEVPKEELLKTTETILSTLTRTSKIVKGLLAFSRSEGQAEFQNISIDQTLGEILGLFQERVKAQNIQLKINTAKNLYIKGSSLQLGQVIMNLINNAFDAIENSPEKWIQIDLLKSSTGAQLTIMDSGPGIPTEVRKKIMEPFFTTKDVGKGTGLGLSISKSIIESHDGKLWLDEQCPNTRFVIDLPLA